MTHSSVSDLAPVSGEDGLLLLDSDTHIVLANPAGARMLGADGPELAGRSIEDICPHPVGARLAAAARRAVEAGAQLRLREALPGHAELEIRLLPHTSGLAILLAPAADGSIDGSTSNGSTGGSIADGSYPTPATDKAAAPKPSAPARPSPKKVRPTPTASASTAPPVSRPDASELGESALMGRCVIDAAMRIVEANAMALRMTGWTAAEIAAGRHAWLELDPTGEHWTSSAGRSERVHFETNHVRPYGESATFGVELFPVDERGMRICHILDVTAVTSLSARLRRAELQLHMLVDHSFDSIHVVDVNGVSQFENASSAFRLGYTPEDHIGKRNESLVHPEDQLGARQLLAEVFEKGQAGPMELRIRHADGSWFIFEVVGTRFTNGAGEPMAVLNARDVTDRKRTENERRVIEAQLNDFFDSGLVGAYIADISGRLVMANGVFLEMIGHTDADVAEGQVDVSRMTPDRCRAADARATMELLELGRCTPYEKELIRADGTSIPVLISSTLSDESLRQVSSIVIDLTARREAEAARRESEERLALALGSAQMGSWDWDLETGEVTWSETMHPLFGLEGGSGSFRTFLHLILPADRSLVLACLRKTLAGSDGQSYELEFRIVRPNGEVRWMLGKGRTFRRRGERAPRISGINMDVTERKRAEEHLRASEARLAGILDIAEDAIISIDERQTITMFNQGAEKIFQYTASEVLGRNLSMLLPTRSRDVHERKVHDFGNSGLVTRHMGERRALFGGTRAIMGRRRDGTEFPADASISKLVTGGQVVYTAIVRDITESERAGAALKRSEEEYRRLFEQAHDAIIIFTPENEEVLDVNERACEIYGYTREEFIGKSLLSLTVEPEQGRSMLERTLRAGEPHLTFETRQRRRNGEEMVLEANAAMIAYQGRIAILSINRDLTERRRLEQQFLQSQKMEAIGRLAGGVAHDFNNILTAITGYADLALGRAGGDEILLNDLMEVKRAADRASSFIRQLLAFGRQQMIQPKLLAINPLIEGSAAMLRRLLGATIEMRTRLSTDTAPVMADPGQMEQVILNLVVNARDAMPDGGTITIVTGNVQVDTPHPAASGSLPSGQYVRIAVSDTGIGMDKQTASQCLEPFFTTKEVGKGSGLGLSTVYGIVKQCGGEIRVDSLPGHGTTFTILIPRAEGISETEDAGSAPGVVAGGTETVLLAEDDPALRLLCTQILMEQGYTVLATGGGEEALLVAGSHGGPIDILVSDVTMPGMRGPVLAAGMRRMFPSIAILFISGHTDDPEFNRGLASGAAGFLQKPFKVEELASKVRNVLDVPR